MNVSAARREGRASVPTDAVLAARPTRQALPHQRSPPGVRGQTRAVARIRVPPQQRRSNRHGVPSGGTAPMRGFDAPLLAPPRVALEGAPRSPATGAVLESNGNAESACL